MQRTCGWCGATTPDAERTHCHACGGPLPALPRAEVGSLVRAPEPPPPPRELPRGYPFRITWTSNVSSLIGLVLTLVSPVSIGLAVAVVLSASDQWFLLLISLVFPGVGIPMLVSGLRRARRELDALRHGVPADGMITRVMLNKTTTINGQHPWHMEYVFDGPGGSFTGVAESWDPAHGRLEEGDPVWVVYVAEAPEKNALWPPVR